jgi:ADP-ribosyl-[dinitrogen reductase] hydrolase
MSSSSSSALTRFDRASGMLYGLAIGDALGAPHEFCRASPKIPYTGIINTEHTVTIQFQYAKMYLPPATTTDDTAMSLALLGSLLDNNLRYDEESVCIAYWKFANAQRTGLGRNSRALFKFKCLEKNAYKGYLRRYEKAISEGDLEACESNGSLMRSAPLILAREGPYQQDYTLSNPNPANESCYQIYSELMKEIYEGKDKNQLKQIVLEASEKVEEDVKNAVLDALSANNKTERDISGSMKGWVCHCLYAALRGFFRFDTMNEAISWIVQIKNSDSDTNASVCGGIWGAYLGKSRMMSDATINENMLIIEKISPIGKDFQSLLSRLKQML